MSFKKIPLFLGGLVMVAIGTGFIVNHFRLQSLPLLYATKQQRLDAAAEHVVENAVSPASPGDGLTAMDTVRYQSFLETIKQHPEESYSEAVSAWQWSDSHALLRLVLKEAEMRTPSTEECDSLRLMQRTLEEPVAQWEECERLSRGNSLEKLIATRRTTLLTKNPQVKDAWDRAADRSAVELSGTGIVESDLGGGFPSSDEPQIVSWQDFRILAESGRGLVLDARVENLYKLGHVPGALNVSREEFARDYERSRSVLDASKERVVAVYCNGLDCEDSKMVAGALLKLGFRRVLIFKGGWQEWTFQHLPRENEESGAVK